MPLPSERQIGVMSVSGRLTPGLSFFNEASFHFLTFPRKMFASTVPVIFRCGGAPGRLYMIDVPDACHGICTQPLQALN